MKAQVVEVDVKLLIAREVHLGNPLKVVAGRQGTVGQCV